MTCPEREINILNKVEWFQFQYTTKSGQSKMIACREGALLPLKFLLESKERTLKLCLSNSGRQITACLFQDAARRIGCTAQAAGYCFREIDCGEQGIDIVHLLKINLATFDVIAAQLIQNIPA